MAYGITEEHTGALFWDWDNISRRESDTGACVGDTVGETSIEEEEEISETSELS